MDLTERIFQELTEIRKAQEETKEVAVRLETILIPTPGQPSVIDELNDRVGKLERLKYWAMGAIAVLSGFWEFLTHNLGMFLHRPPQIK